MITVAMIRKGMEQLKEQGIRPIETDKDFVEYMMTPSFSKPLEKAKEKPMKKPKGQKPPKGGKKGC